MSLPGVFERGDEFIGQYPRTSRVWQFFSHATCLATVGFSKAVLFLGYNLEVKGVEHLDRAVQRTVEEDRGIMTIMNHMSCVDDPFIWGCLPWRFYRDVDQIRWCLGAQNVCFKGELLSTFFSLGKILSTVRFGGGPFQGSIDAAIRLLSPDDTLGLLYDGSEDTARRWADYSAADRVRQLSSHYTPPLRRFKPSWVHVYPEGFVLQLQPPFNNSMRYFKWGVTRMILESTRQPIIVPIFSTGFEKIAPESAASGSLLERFLPDNLGAEIRVTIGEAIDDKIIKKYRDEWMELVRTLGSDARDLTDELKFGPKAQELRSRLAAELRSSIAELRKKCGFPDEDPRFKDHKFWRRYTKSEGASDPDVKFIGQNWAIRRLQGIVDDDDAHDDAHNE